MVFLQTVKTSKNRVAAITKAVQKAFKGIKIKLL